MKIGRAKDLPCPVCTEHGVNRRADGTWRCRACGARGATLEDGKTMRLAVLSRPIAVDPPNSTLRVSRPLRVSRIGHLTPAERLARGLLRDGKGVKLDPTEIARRTRAQREGEAVRKATRRLDRAKEQAA